MSLRYYEWQYDALEEKINNAFLLVFMGEFLLKFFGFGWRYFTVGWNIFDFSVVVLSILTYYIT
jgi:hypothetical protein